MRLFFLLLVLSLSFCKSHEDAHLPVVTQVSLPAEPSNEAISIPVQNEGEMVTEYPYAVTVKDNQNQAHRSEKILPQVEVPTVMMFWLTTCNPCARELKTITENFAQWQQSVPFHLVAMSEDREENYPAFVERIASEKWPFPAYWDFNRDFKSLMPGNLNGLPQTFIFDKNGKMTWSKRGFLPGDEEVLLEKIKEAARS